jgi:acyl carrier protein
VSNKQVIREFLMTLAHRDIPIEDDDSLLATRLLDSLKIAELIVFLESHYRVTFTEDELMPDNLDTINAIVGLLVRKGVQ